MSAYFIITLDGKPQQFESGRPVDCKRDAATTFHCEGDAWLIAFRAWPKAMDYSRVNIEPLREEL